MPLGQGLGHAESHMAVPQAGLFEALAQLQLCGYQLQQAGGTGLAHIGVTQAGRQQREDCLGSLRRGGVHSNLQAEIVVLLL